MGRIVLLLFLLAGLTATAQISPEKLATGRMDKGKWQKTEQSLRKALLKDSLDAEPRYLLSLYYFTARNPAYNIDSAFVHVEGARRIFGKTLPRDRERLRRIPLDSMILNRLAAGIDSAAFEKAKKQNTEASYQHFIDNHRSARQRTAAVELRDEVAYLEALKANTWFGFKVFMSKYPASHRYEDASSRYDKLLYEDKTRDQHLTSYVRFCQQFPDSPYQPLAERNIFEIATASGAPEAFRWFIDNYPASRWSGRAKNILYALQTLDDDKAFDPAWTTDSLKRVEQLNRYYWVPIYKSGMYGFMDELGAETIAPKFQSVSEDYRCGDIHDRLLATSKGLLARNEVVLWPGHTETIREIGSGFILLSSDSAKYVIHESGFRVGSGPVDGAQTLANRFIALEKNRKWTLFSLTGKVLLPSTFDEVSSFDSLLVLSRKAKRILTTPGRVGRVADKSEFKEDFVFDEVRRWGPRQYWVRNGILEGVIDDHLNFVIPPDRQVLKKTSFGFLRGKDDKIYIQGISGLEKDPYRTVTDQAGWVRLQTMAGRYLLYEKALARLVEGDSAWFQGRLVFLLVGDSVNVFLPSGQKLSLQEKGFMQFMEYGDSLAWLVLEEKKKKAVFDAASGSKLFAVDADQIDAVGRDLFQVTRAGKKGLVSQEGKILVPVEYDAVVAAGKGGYSLLKDKKFGWYDHRARVLIKPGYDRNVKSYNDQLRIAYRDKGYGFMLADGKPLGNFEWEEIEYWSDSAAWVKRNFRWMLLSIHSQKVTLDRVRDFTVISDSPAEKIYLVHQENAFGVVSSRRGIVVPIQYSDIVNLGNKETPLYFTERHIEEAGISVIVYYDCAGKIIRKQAMEADEFEKIYCDN